MRKEIKMCVDFWYQIFLLKFISLILRCSMIAWWENFSWRPNDIDINIYKSAYCLQQWEKLTPHLKYKWLLQNVKQYISEIQLLDLYYNERKQIWQTATNVNNRITSSSLLSEHKESVSVKNSNQKFRTNNETIFTNHSWHPK